MRKDLSREKERVMRKGCERLHQDEENEERKDL